MNIRRPGLRALAVTGSTVAVAAAFASVGGARTAATPPSNTALPTISGSTNQGDVLSASPGSWSGDNPITFTYQWQRCDSSGGSCANIAGATAQTYTLVLADVNGRLLVNVTGHNGAGTGGPAASAKTGVILGSTPPTNSALPAISGSGTVGSTLTTSNGTWGGTAPITYTYAWGRCNSSGAACAAIGGATAHTYVVVSADVGHTLRATVTATNAAGSGQATSNATAAIVVGAPVNTATPVVTGTAKEGQTLSATGGTWTGAEPITYTFQWWRCNTDGSNCATISGATTASYKLTTADVGHAVRIRITATNSAGSTSAVSGLTAQVASASGTTTTTTTTSTPPPSGTVKLPNGEISIPAANVPDTDRLLVSSVKVSPSAIQGRAPVSITFKITEANKYDVSGALVYVLALPYGWAAKVPEAATGTDGTVTISVAPSVHAPKKGALVLFVRARTPHGSVLAGSSTRRLIQVKIKP